MSVREAFRDPRGYVVRTAGMYRALLFDPERFYDEYVGSRGIWLEIVVVLFVGALGLAGNVYLYNQLTFAFAEANISIGADANFNLVGTTMSPLVGAALLWILFSGAMYVLGWLYSTVGQFFPILKRTAWALVPIAFYNVIQSAVKGYFAFQYAEEDAESVGQIPRPSGQRAEFIWGEVGQEPLVLGAVAVGVVFAIWMGYIGAYAVADERDLERADALKVALVPAVGYALYIVYQVATTAL